MQTWETVETWWRHDPVWAGEETVRRCRAYLELNGQDMMRQKLGRAAYDAYCGARGWNSFDGKPLPKWPEVKPEIQEAWCIAAEAVVAAIERQDKDKLKKAL